MHPRFVGAGLVAAALLGSGRSDASTSFVFIIQPLPPALPTCPDGSSAGPLAAALDALGDALSESASCSSPRVCGLAESRLTAAFGAACAEQASEGLAQAAQAVSLLDRDRALSTFAQRNALESLVEVSDHLVSERLDDLEEAVDRLCSGARAGMEKALARLEQVVERAQVDAGNDTEASALRAFASAASALDAAEKNAASKASGCRPRACRSGEPFAFDPGLASSPSLELVPPDRGTLAVYRISGDDVASGGAVGGTLRLAWTALTRASVRTELQSPRGSAAWEGSHATSACLDVQGWYRLTKVSETFRSTSGARRSGGGSVSFAPGAVSVAPVGLVPVVPRALAVRVGDGIDENELQVGGRDAGGAVRVGCAESHRVVAIEELRVPAGTFEAARVESRFRCGNGLDLSSVAWLASEVGFARAELRDRDTFTRFELECFETPESAGRCPPAAPAAAPGAGVVTLPVSTPPGSAVAGSGAQLTLTNSLLNGRISVELAGSREARVLQLQERPATEP